MQTVFCKCEFQGVHVIHASSFKTLSVKQRWLLRIQIKAIETSKNRGALMEWSTSLRTFVFAAIIILVSGDSLIIPPDYSDPVSIIFCLSISKLILRFT